MSFVGYDMGNISIRIKRSTFVLAGVGGVLVLLVLVTIAWHSGSGVHQLLEKLLASNAVSVEGLSKISDNFCLQVRGSTQHWTV